jgi:hypothetical protein
MYSIGRGFEKHEKKVMQQKIVFLLQKTGKSWCLLHTMVPVFQNKFCLRCRFVMYFSTLISEQNPEPDKQCCGSGSTCFWASWIWIRIHLSEVWIRIRILLSSCKKNSKNNLDSYYFVTPLLFIFEK